MKKLNKVFGGIVAVGVIAITLQSVFAFNLSNAQLLPKSGASDVCATDRTDAIEWHFVINGLKNSETTPPASITAVFANAGTVTVPQTNLNTNEAGYTWSSDLGDTLLSASAALPDNFQGRFNLSHWPCVAAKLTLVKVVSGGNATPADFTLSADGTGSNDFSGHGPTVVSPSTLTPDTFTLSETNLENYTPSDWVCTGGTQNGNLITLASGQSATCTVTNTFVDPCPDNSCNTPLPPNPGTLIVRKVVVNDNGGTMTAGSFSFSVNDSPATNFTENDSLHGSNSLSVDPGTYSVTETSAPGYTTTYDNCSNVVVGSDQTKVCTITNDDIAPQLTIIKHVINDNGGTKNAGNFTMNVTGPSATPASFAGSETGTTVTLNAGSYSVDETADSGYAKTLSADCSGTIAIGETKTCTVTNNDIAPKLIVKKHVINDNGGTMVDSQFTLNVTGVNPSQTSVVGNEDGTVVTLDAGNYSVTEGTTAGYAGSTSTDCSGTINVGEIKTCTVTNNDVPPILTLNKNVINDNGGTELPSAWTLTATGPTSLSGTSGVTSDSTFSSGTYSLTESNGPTGYAASAWTCTGATVTDGSITLDLGQVATCSITNDDIAPKLTVTKVVTNDNGGTKTVSDFPLSVNGNAVTSGVENTLNAGAYTVAETNDATKYAGTISGDCATDGTITLHPGDVKSCTITNNDIAPKLTLVKNVINNDWGTSVASDFTLTATGPSTLTGAGGATSDGTFKAGTYNLSESGPAGYASSGWTCTGVTNVGGAITLGLGQTATCSITNDDLAGRMTGGGSISTTGADLPKAGNRVTHGFELACKDPVTYAKKNNLEINWNIKGNNSDKFHLDKLTSVSCIDDPTINPGKPETNGFDTISGTGTGSYNGVTGYNISFTMSDAGEPGKNDKAMFKVWKGTSAPVLNTTEGRYLDQGNQQAHRF